MRDDREPWSQKKVMRRLRAVVSSIPGANIGGSTQSTALSGIVSYAIDAEIGLKLTRTVLSALLCPPPHPEFGDDGSREEIRRDALDSLEWAEAWLAWRTRLAWSASSRVMWRGEVPDAP